MCCACGGGINTGNDENEEAPVTETTDEGADTWVGSCRNTDGGATDSYGDSCAAYKGYTGWCGLYDDDDFTANSMCCVCGGGEN